MDWGGSRDSRKEGKPDCEGKDSGRGVVGLPALGVGTTLGLGFWEGVDSTRKRFSGPKPGGIGMLAFGSASRDGESSVYCWHCMVMADTRYLYELVIKSPSSNRLQGSNQ